MEKYFKNIDNDVISSISTGSGMEEITQEEYDAILALIRQRPQAPEGYAYLLRQDLTWELTETPVIPEDTEISAEEALQIIMGGEE